ncbi:hypothetical protein AAKU67_004456 [Oxalobacteraceae bacterium GrIS 2.11]
MDSDIVFDEIPGLFDDDGKTIFHFGVTSQIEVDNVTSFVNAGWGVDDRDQNGQTPLHIAAQYGTLETVQRLLALGADPYVADIFGRTPAEVVDLAFNTLPGKGDSYVSRTAPNDFFDQSLTEYLRSLDMESFASWVLAQHEKARLLNSARHEYEGKVSKTNNILLQQRSCSTSQTTVP